MHDGCSARKRPDGLRDPQPLLLTTPLERKLHYAPCRTRSKGEPAQKRSVSQAACALKPVLAPPFREKLAGWRMYEEAFRSRGRRFPPVDDGRSHVLIDHARSVLPAQSVRA